MIRTSQLERRINNAGKSFIGLHMSNVLSMISDGYSKDAIIEKLYKNQVGFIDKGIRGTQTRVSSLFHIIKEENVVNALQIVIDSPVPLRNGAKERARETIEMIDSGEIKLPKLD